MKFLCSMLVVAIHTSPFLEFNKDISYGFVNVLARIAVPFFFTASGYFFMKKISKVSTITVFTTYVKRLFILYIGWSLVYFPADIRSLLSQSDNLSVVVAQYLKKFFFLGTSDHLWYIPSLMLAITLLYVAFVKKKIKLFFILSLIFYGFGLIGDSYFGLIKDIHILSDIYTLYFRFFENTRNGLFFGFLFVMLGAMIFLHREKTHEKIHVSFSLTMFVLLFIEAFALRFFHIPKDCNLYIMNVPFIFYFFNYLLSLDFELNKTLSYTFRVYSIGIYFIHVVFLILYSTLFRILNLSDIQTLYFLLVVLSSIVSIYVIKKFRIPFFNNLIS